MARLIDGFVSLRSENTPWRRPGLTVSMRVSLAPVWCGVNPASHARVITEEGLQDQEEWTRRCSGQPWRGGVSKGRVVVREQRGGRTVPVSCLIEHARGGSDRAWVEHWTGLCHPPRSGWGPLADASHDHASVGNAVGRKQEASYTDAELGHTTVPRSQFGPGIWIAIEGCYFGNIYITGPPFEKYCIFLKVLNGKTISGQTQAIEGPSSP
jgi:hypothetical protein